LQIALLQETRDSPVCKTDRIVTKSKTCLALVEGFLLKLNEAGLIALADKEIEVTSEQRMRIAELAIFTGADSERVARELRWQEFEGLAANILDMEGYATAKHFIFRNSARKYEIDVLGAKEPMVLCVDCKHWHHGWAPSRIVQAARNQMMRVLCLSETYALYAKLRIAGWRSARLLPIVLTLADVSSKLVDGVPIVSALRLRDFLCKVSPWDEQLRFVDARARSQAPLFS
jgi:Holliday junction resolvase-like predicted endonuclease